MFHSKGPTTDEDTNPPAEHSQEQERGSASNPSQTSAPARQSSTTRKLPAGTGIGTTGKPAPTEQTRQAATTRDVSEMRKSDVPSTMTGRSGILEGAHDYGHARYGSQELKPSGLVQEDTNQLNPVTHERIRHVETEEVQRVKDRDRHIHHVQHHIQPVLASETLPERSRELVHPVTNVQEIHANKPEDTTLFEGQVRQHHDTVVHSEKERTIIDKGTVINEHIHHHIHHVIQPIIEKETIDRERIRTTIPIHEVTHEAPVIHESQIHTAVPIEHFLRDGGALTGAVSQADIKTRVLHSGKCTREVEGVADTITKELKIGEELGPDPTTTTTDRTYVYTEHDASQDQPDIGASRTDGPYRSAFERDRAAEAAKPISVPNA